MFTVIIPSRTECNVLACVGAIQRNEMLSKIIIVDDGISHTPKSLRFKAFKNVWEDPARADDYAITVPRIVAGEKPFIFSRNCNIGIRAAGQDDVILLNDDALLQTTGGFSALSAIAAEHPEYGLIGAACNNVGNINQRQRNIGLRYEPRMVCFICVYIPRSTIERVGLLDEDYTEYGSEDDDYCYRVRKAGLRIGIFDGCFVDHAHLRSTFRGNGGRDIKPGIEIFKRKHGGYPL